MKKLTYQEAYDRIVGAYFGNELNPFIDCACFVGNLLGGNGRWACVRTFKRYDAEPGSEMDLTQPVRSASWYSERYIAEDSCGTYSSDEVVRLENMFLSTYLRRRKIKNGTVREEGRQEFNEDLLFEAMDKTLDLLKEIHESHGEVVDRPAFARRAVRV